MSLVDSNSLARVFLRSPRFLACAMEPLKALCRRGVQCPLARDINSQEETQCQVKSALKTTLEVYFHYDNFRPGQLASTLGSTHGVDVFVRMATGAGKSLCLFLGPLAVSDAAMGIIISPLIGLMDQQVRIIVMNCSPHVYAVACRLMY